MNYVPNELNNLLPQLKSRATEDYYMQLKMTNILRGISSNISLKWHYIWCDSFGFGLFLEF